MLLQGREAVNQAVVAGGRRKQRPEVGKGSDPGLSRPAPNRGIRVPGDEVGE